ncbi:SufD family Fe-S cluster assembly protein [Lentilactobacillus sp. SPB1-3]|uniref:SufD family Fe-S cluster assembly protein n=1 Tax=Lentilactobacillus terminaliae TaxID=3003483 RepID=A0ACD5DFE0_9LACO|nr:SufD family Fe-S cluster assembly protein [Lentilactobacillus sp. SPB1-3]MCZ0976373.1 SufD family Fe-S cluster assembly protein [Lentilactobacillus sp. SPB1-3]
MQELSSQANNAWNNDKSHKNMEIDYSTSLFDWQAVNNSEWQWNASQDALAELTSKGGNIQSFSSKSLTPDELKSLTTQMETNNNNQILLNHFKHNIDGIMIFVPDDTVIDEPLNLTIDAAANDSVALTLILNVGNNSQVSINERINISGNIQQASIDLTGSILRNSTVNLSTILTSLSETKLNVFSDQTVRQDAKLTWTYFSSSRGNVSGDLITHLVEPRAISKFYGLQIAHASDEINLQVSGNHHAPNTNSSISMRGVLLNQAKFNFTGVSQIDAVGTNSDSKLDGRLLTVGEDAVGSVNPLLKNDKTNATTTQTASVSSLDDDQIADLLASGVSRDKAKQTLINGFISPVVHQLPIEAVGIVHHYFE